MRKAILVSTLLSAMLLATTPAWASDPEKVEEALDRYWSEREMPVIAGDQLFTVENKLEFTVFGGIVPNDPFTSYFPVGLRTGYSFDGIWGIELDFAYLGELNVNSELTDFLIDEGAGIRRDVDLGDHQVLRADLVAVFSPLYGKWSLQTYKISHFDLFIVAGVGMVMVEEPAFDEGNPDPRAEPETGVNFEGLFGAGFRFWLTEYVGLRIDARWMFYTNFEDEIQAPAEITLGFSFLTPSL